MTPQTGMHRHITIAVKRDGLVHRMLTRPTLAVVSRERAEQSRLVYGPVLDESGQIVPDRYRLSPLGLLHGLIGLTLCVDCEGKGSG